MACRTAEVRGNAGGPAAGVSLCLCGLAPIAAAQSSEVIFRRDGLMAPTPTAGGKPRASGLRLQPVNGTRRARHLAGAYVLVRRLPAKLALKNKVALSFAAESDLLWAHGPRHTAALCRIDCRPLLRSDQATLHSLRFSRRHTPRLELSMPLL